MTVFGLQWTQAAAENVAYARPAESVLTSLTPATTIAQCNTYAPWSGMRRCNLWDDGTPTAYYGDRCYTDTDVANMGQAMVKIPKFWYTTNHGGGVYMWYISDTGADALPAGADHAWAVHPAFIRALATRSYIYFGAYEAYKNGTKLESKAGVTPTATQTIAQFRTAAQARGTGWEQQDYLTSCAIQLLYLIEYGNFNSQSTSLGIGPGITTLAAETHRVTPCFTGHTTSLGNASGQGDAFTTTTLEGLVSPDSATTNVKAVSYRGLENPWGNIWGFVEGINIGGTGTDYRVWVADNGFDSTLHDGTIYKDTGLTIGGTLGNYTSDIAVSAAYDYGFIPSSTTGGTSTAKLCDWMVSATGNCILCNSANWGYAAQAGLFHFNSQKTTTQSVNSYGARLMYIG